MEGKHGFCSQWVCDSRSPRQRFDHILTMVCAFDKTDNAKAFLNTYIFPTAAREQPSVRVGSQEEE